MKKQFRSLTVFGLGACLLVGGVFNQAVAGPTKTEDHGGRFGGPGGGPGRGMRMRKMMEEKLGLTAAQKTKLEAIFKNSRSQMESLRDQRLTEDERRQKFMALREDRMKKINAILTPAQKKKLAEFRPQRPGRGDGREGRGFGGPGGGPGFGGQR